MTRTRGLAILLFFVAFFRATDAGKVASAPSTSTDKCIQDIRLDSAAVLAFARETAARGVMTRLPQIDILDAVFRHYRADLALSTGRSRIILNGDCFGSAYAQIEEIFRLPHAEEETILKSCERPPEIKYSNFRDIVLSCTESVPRINIHLRRAYIQELPYTFGACIRLEKNIHGTLRASRKVRATEVLFDDDRSVLFEPPAFAFFIPKIHTRIARIEDRNGAMFGFVIGRPKSAPDRYVSLRYNLTTCAKSSIRTSEMSPDEYRRKLADPDFPMF
ncbi:MAG: hypothetical protein V1913_03070 [Fibrobacterota bacterium]